MILEICIKGFVGRVFFLTLKMGLKRRKVENHCFKGRLGGHQTRHFGDITSVIISLMIVPDYRNC